MLMKRIRKNTTKNLAILSLLILAMLLTASCTGTDKDQNDTDTQPGTQSDDIEYPNHDLDTNPVPFSDAESALSIVGYGAIGALADTELSLMDMLRYAVEDEYLAHGEYAAIIEEFGNRNPYVNIMRSEEVHLSLLENVYDTYGLEFPKDSSADQLIIPNSLLEAAQIGVQAEIDNIAMYEKFLSYELPDNLEQTFTALRNASEMHLHAFQRQVDRLSR